MTRPGPIGPRLTYTVFLKIQFLFIRRSNSPGIIQVSDLPEAVSRWGLHTTLLSN